MNSVPRIFNRILFLVCIAAATAACGGGGGGGGGNSDVGGSGPVTNPGGDTGGTPGGGSGDGSGDGSGGGTDGGSGGSSDGGAGSGSGGSTGGGAGSGSGDSTGGGTGGGSGDSSGGGTGGGSDGSNGYVTLTWESPTTRTDGSCLSELQAYKVSYGLSPGHYTQSQSIEASRMSCSNSGNSACGPVQACSFMVEGLGSADWYFAVQAVDSDGQESAYSNEELGRAH